MTRVNHNEEEELLIVNEVRQTATDFEFLAHMAYSDEESRIVFVTTRVTTSRKFIVEYREPVVVGRLGLENPKLYKIR